MNWKALIALSKFWGPLLNLPTKNIRTYYKSLQYSNLRVIDKKNGGKADALNAGINHSIHPLICSLDADSILDPNSLRAVVMPFMVDATTIATAGTVRVANGNELHDGKFRNMHVPHSLLPLIQTVEYIRAFNFGRLGWVPIKSLLILSGAFSVFQKQAVVDIGGYSADTVGEDMEIVLRLHRYMLNKGIPYAITHVPEAICWTEVPEDIGSLYKQRIRWQRGLGESLSNNEDMFFSKKTGLLGNFALPFSLFFELLIPILEIVGILFFVLGFWYGNISYYGLMSFLIVSIGFATIISFFSIILDQLSFRIYNSIGGISMLFLGAVIENMGYRQLTSVPRFIGITKFLFNHKYHW